MRFYLPLGLPLLLLACDGGHDRQSGMNANIENATPPEEPVEEFPANNAAAPPGNDTAPGGEESGSLIPASLQGRWTGIGEDCQDRSAELRLSITPKTLVFLESVGTVTGVERQADGRLKIDASFTGEGQSWTRSLILKPSAKGQELTMVNDGVAVTRKRCS
ncbi:hypothetical protein [Sphingobium cloacae]|uniref:Lipoprotein n=1 Tax=Sphingobium cloacae TaxID=120107 RepID=A0A1E1F2G6_9SPHN|nr:hypothetical protein [Sphingobium cloacae]BAV64719.1 hypothetical protein SCLO_1016790 [Sphingobium cloacae]